MAHSESMGTLICHSHTSLTEFTVVSLDNWHHLGAYDVLSQTNFLSLRWMDIQVKRAISRTYKSRSSVLLFTCLNDQEQFSVLITHLKVLKSSEIFLSFFIFLMSTNYRISTIDVFWGKKKNHKPLVTLVKTFTKTGLKYTKRKIIMRLNFCNYKSCK